MADEIIRMEDIYADDIVGNINEVREARGTFESLDARLDNIGGGNAPSPSTSDPAMDGTASPGSADTYSRGDHVHPTDMSRQAVIDSSHKLSSDLVDDTNNTHKFATAAQLQQISTNEANISSILDGTTIDSFGDVESALADKVDKETGKGLSTNDYTTAEKTKLENLAEIKTVGTGLNLDDNGELTATGGGSGDTTNYNDLSNKPQINGNTLSGNKTSAQLGLASASDIPTTLADLSDDSTHRTVSDTEKATWNTKQNAISDLETIRSGASAGATAVQPISGKGLSTNDYTNDEKTKLSGIAEGAEVNVQSDWTQTTTTADDYIKNKPTLGTAAAKNATDTYDATGTDVTTGKAVAAALATLPEPMVFKGSLGTGGTITTLPTASSSNKGYTYKVITAGTYASQSAKVGDTFISDGSAWVLIPSGDEPGGTVTNVAVANGGGLTVSGSPVTSSGTITVGHSNSVTAKTSYSVKKFTYDEYGHVTGSSELSTAESNALASGIDSTKVAQIETNKNNISKQQDTIAEGGNGYAIINGKRLYMTDSTPTNGRNGDIWIDGNTIYQYTTIPNVATVSIEQGTFNTDGSESPNNKRIRTTFDTNIYMKGSYTVSITGANEVLMFVYDSNKTCIQAEGSGGWKVLPYSFELSGDRYVRFAFRKTNDVTISPSDVSDYALMFAGWYK